MRHQLGVIFPGSLPFRIFVAKSIMMLDSPSMMKWVMF
jgi:hypothetical protein